MSSEPPTQKLGEEGDTCEECGAVLATDQRYCLNCGTRRGGPRVEPVQRVLAGAAGAAGPAGDASTIDMQAAPSTLGRNEWTPPMIIGSVALLGVFLLLGVLIGKNNNNTATVAAGPAATSTAATSTTAATTSTPTATTASKGAKPTKAAGGAVAGGSGSTAGVPTANLAPKTGQAAVNASKNGPNVVATPGPAAANNPSRKPGGGSSGTCIGC